MARPNRLAGPRYDSDTGRAAAQKHVERLRTDPEYSAEYRKRVSEAMPNSMGKSLFECAVCDRLYWSWVAAGKRRHTCEDPECRIEIKRIVGRMGGKPAHKPK